MSEPHGPPRLWVWLATRLAPRHVRDEALDELADLHALRAVRDGRSHADRWYRRNVIRFALSLHAATLLGGHLGPPSPFKRKTRSRMWNALVQETAWALRRLLRERRFATTAVLTLGLGIGVTTSIFSLFHGVLLAPLPYPDADRLYAVGSTPSARPRPAGTVSWCTQFRRPHSMFCAAVRIDHSPALLPLVARRSFCAKARKRNS